MPVRLSQEISCRTANWAVCGAENSRWPFQRLPRRGSASKLAAFMPKTLQLEVLNELGLHARPATEFVRCAMRYSPTTITIHKEGEVYVATSILEVLTANLDMGAVFTLEADGPEADAALRELAGLLEHFRDEERAERNPAH